MPSLVSKSYIHLFCLNAEEVDSMAQQRQPSAVMAAHCPAVINRRPSADFLANALKNLV